MIDQTCFADIAAEVWNRHLLFDQIAEQKLKRRNLYPLGITLLAVPHSRARRAASDPRLQSQQVLQQNSSLHEERRGHFKQTKKAKQGSCEATINVALMEYEGDVLKPIRGVLRQSKHGKPLIIPLCWKGLCLAYQYARIAKQIPGSDQDLVLKSYKKWLGRSYSRLTLYLSPISKLEEVLDLDRVDIHDSLFDEWFKVQGSIISHYLRLT